jgi:hypothetical protein
LWENCGPFEYRRYKKNKKDRRKEKYWKKKATRGKD